MDIGYSVEETPLGTAGSVRLAAGQLDDTFLVISGDALCDVDLTRLIAYHREKKASVTIGLKAVDNPLEFGIVVTDDDGRVERFLEKPSWGQVFSDTINTGIYVLEPEVLDHVPTDRPYDFSKELFPLLLEMGRPIYGCVLDGYWQDIGNLDQYRQANFDALDERVNLNIGGIRIRGNVWIGDGVDVHDLEAIEGPAYLGNYCRISPQAAIGPYSVLSTSVTVRDGARTSHSIVDASTYIGRSTVVEGAIVGRSCDLRAHVRVHEGVAIGDEVTIGAESVIMPGVRIYPYKEVETGSQIHESLIWESRGTTRVFGKDGVSGMVNVDLTPDTAVRLAAAFGTALKRDARVVASREGTPACRMIKRAMISGVSSTGVDVADLRVIPASVARHLVKSEGYRAGFHVGQSPTDPEVIRIQFFEQPGIEMTAGLAGGGREALHARRAAARVGLRGRDAVVSRPHPGELCERPPHDRRRGGDPAARLPHRRRLRPVGRVVRASHRPRAARRRGGGRARVPERGRGRGARARRVDRAGAAARPGGGSGSRRRLRPGRRAPLPRRRAGARDSGRAGAAALRQADRVERRRAGSSRSPSPSRARSTGSSRARSSRSCARRPRCPP